MQEGGKNGSAGQGEVDRGGDAVSGVKARSVAGLDVVPHSTGLAGDVAAPVVLAVAAMVSAESVGDEAPATAHHAAPVHALGAGIASSEEE